MKYNFYQQFALSGNVSYAPLYRKQLNDGLEESFNTPRWIINVSVGSPAVFKQVGFQLGYHWQDAFFWQSSLGTGTVPAYHTFDAQLSLQVPLAKLWQKIGGTNLLNQRYYQMIAGLTIGAMYYQTLVFDHHPQ